jgi:hypothetical protein
MTSSFGRNSARTDSASGPRRVVATFDTYADAEHAVDYLSDNGFPVERTAIVARDLEFVEYITGRMDYGQAALRGALTGGLVGLLVGWLFAVFNWFDPIVSSFWLVIDGRWFGALVGTVFGLVSHALTGGRRDFSSVGAMKANRYEVLVDEDVASEAERLLSEQGRPTPVASK